MIIVAGLVIAFVLMLIFARRDMRYCRWRKDRDAGEWRCAYCGAVSEGLDPPERCLRPRDGA
ncbi:hypothetical protein K1T73_16745 [Roseovarius sp. SCSIO 43702]|uniref:hypothetical protein n=1 Tax=Roseovarius sp. SCSIO 43702 TaxID=2823043 RepID=UPI001C7341FE|nr:hypothetical protein [Roseovarius sp. SCSIO 43702]QYX56660.1 hypothetical protein K1T73_16745 [Roseovarius sp. SCSIO 43702]